MKRLLKPIFTRSDIFAEDETDTEVSTEDTEFGDPDDVQVDPDVEKAFNKLVEQLRKTAYEDLGPELEDIVKDPKLYAIFKEGFGTGDMASVHMSSSTTAIDVTSLLPSQSEIGLDNSLKYPLKQDCSAMFSGSPITIVAPIVTYRKTFVVDGHHRWSQIYMVNPKAKVNAINFDYQATSPYRILRNFQGAIAVARKEVPQSHGGVNNVYAMSESQIRDYISSNIQDVCWNSLVKAGVCEDKEGAIDYLTENAMQLKSDNPPFAQAPDRDYMPQTDEKSIQIAKEGQTDI